MMPPQQPTVFMDFDGTITTRDATDAILEAFADPQWLAIEDAWKAGRIGSRECLTAQMALVNARADQMDALLDDIDVDPALPRLLDWCASRHVPVHIVSDGFDYCIRRILERPTLGVSHHLAQMTVVSSRLRPEGARWRASFTGACEHGCATCKPAAMARLNASGGPTIFVGDGLSDRYAASAADVVFAKDGLAAYCHERAIPHTSFLDLSTVLRDLESLLMSDAGMSKAYSGKAFPPT